MVQMVKNLPAMQETRVWSLDQEDPLEKEMATHSNILAWMGKLAQRDTLALSALFPTMACELAIISKV